ncbi:hypothetical protein D3C84_980560 [compost metagenome]
MCTEVAVADVPFNNGEIAVSFAHERNFRSRVAVRSYFGRYVRQHTRCRIHPHDSRLARRHRSRRIDADRHILAE